MKITYKLWVVNCIVLVFIYLFAYPFIVYYFYWPVNKEIIWINSILNQKEILAETIKKNKLVFGGGSATLFGIRTKDVQDESGIPSINMAVHAGLQINYYLHRLKRSLRHGDIVILPLEYTHFNYNGDIDIVTINYIMRYDRKYFNSLPLIDKVQYCFAVAPVSFLSSILDNLIDFMYGKYFSITNDVNSNGDGMGNNGTDKVDRMLKYAKPFEIQKGTFKETIGLESIKKFDLWCKSNNITCYITYANTLFFEEYNNNEYIKYFSNLRQYFTKNKIMTLGNPFNFFFIKDFFYDTQYHLNQQGMSIRTEQLIKLMKDNSVICQFVKVNSQ